MLTLVLATGLAACGDDEDGGGSSGSAGDSADSDSTSGAGETEGTSAGPGGGGDTAGDTDTDGEQTEPDPEDDGPWDGNGCRYIDVLMMVDISESMAEEKEALESAFPAFIEGLDNYVADPETSAVRYRVGATNSTMVDNSPERDSTFGLDGSLFSGGENRALDLGCRLDFDPPWIWGPSAGFLERLACLVNGPIDADGDWDSGKERPFDAINAFVDKSSAGGPNEGFYRQDGGLLVYIYVTDEDDDMEFSQSSAADAKASLDALTGGESRYASIVISAPAEMGCPNGVWGEAFAAPRLHEFSALVPNGVTANICDGQFEGPLQTALATIQSACEGLGPI